MTSAAAQSKRIGYSVMTVDASGGSWGGSSGLDPGDVGLAQVGVKRARGHGRELTFFGDGSFPQPGRDVVGKA